MKIIFENGYTYDINAIEFEMYNGNPIDIIIAADEQTLNDITIMSMIGCNIREMEPWDKFFGKASHIGLYAHLYPFKVINNNNN